jgi:hypothetical protein
MTQGILNRSFQEQERDVKNQEDFIPVSEPPSLALAETCSSLARQHQTEAVQKFTKSINLKSTGKLLLQMLMSFYSLSCYIKILIKLDHRHLGPRTLGLKYLAINCRFAMICMKAAH